MKYIVINSETLDLKVATRKPRNGVAIPLSHKNVDAPDDPLFELTYFTGCYGYWASKQPPGPRLAAKLIEPDPWLLALVGIMWEGLIQGASWDVIKVAVLRAVTTLRSHRLAPLPAASHNERRVKRTETEVGFHYQQFTEDGEPLSALFLGIRRKFQQMSEQERSAVTSHAEQRQLPPSSASKKVSRKDGERSPKKVKKPGQRRKKR